MTQEEAAPVRPDPLVTPESERYWQGCRDHELWLRACTSCGQWYFYPRDLCPHCGSRAVEWRRASGRGTLYTFAIAHRPPLPWFRDLVPYVTAMIDLEEGPRMLSNLVGVEPDPAAIAIGMPVTVEYLDISETATIPVFRPAGDP